MEAKWQEIACGSHTSPFSLAQAFTPAVTRQTTIFPFSSSPLQGAMNRLQPLKKSFEETI
jgi:hypothetical protein